MYWRLYWQMGKRASDLATARDLMRNALRYVVPLDTSRPFSVANRSGRESLPLFFPAPIKNAISSFASAILLNLCIVC